MEPRAGPPKATPQRALRSPEIGLLSAQLYWDSPINLVESLDTYNIVTGVGFGGGSICFTVGAALLLMRQVR